MKDKSYSVLVDQKVVKNDFKALGEHTQKRIKHVVKAKLETHPNVFGKPLRYSLKHAWVLRVGDYRVLYVIHEEQKEVRVVLVCHRKNVYSEAKNRIV